MNPQGIALLRHVVNAPAVGLLLSIDRQRYHSFRE